MLKIPKPASLHSFLLHCQGVVYEHRTKVLFHRLQTQYVSLMLSLFD